MKPDLRYLICPFCGAGDLNLLLADIQDHTIYDSGILCMSCNRTYPIIWGVPFLGSYKKEEILSLLEIASTTDSYNISNRDSKPMNLDYKKWIEATNQYIRNPDLEELRKGMGLKEVPDWFWNRYREHLQFCYLTQYVELTGKEILDVGAGSGYDSLKFSLAGATVTSLEFNPALFGTGRYNFTELRWIGGSSHSLPFQDDSFDVVVANAALHHMIDIPVTISEMLRVLKPGGTLMTISDSYCNNSYSEEEEAAIFNTHTAVLMGINEQVPNFRHFVEAFKKYSDNLTIRVFTQTCYDFCPHPREWSFAEALSQLPATSGGISFLARKERSSVIKRNIAVEPVIHAAAFARHLNNQTAAVSTLVDLIPQEYTDMELLSSRHPKFRLLNGWQLHQAGERKRGAYGRARMFYNIDKLKSKYISVGILVPYHEKFNNPLLRFKINNQVLFEKEIIRGYWDDIYCPLVNVGSGSTKQFALELELSSDCDSFEARHFYVRAIEFTNEVAIQEPFSMERLEKFGIDTIISAGAINMNEVTALLSSDVEHGINVINRLRKRSVAVNCIVPEGQQAFYTWLRGTTVMGTYGNKDLGRSNGNKIDINIIVASDRKEVLELSELINKHDKVFVVYKKGYSDHLRNVLAQRDTPVPASSYTVGDFNKTIDELQAIKSSRKYKVICKITDIINKFPIIGPAIRKVATKFI